MLSEGLTKLGCQVKVITNTPGHGDDSRFPYEIIRRPGFFTILRLMRWCDLFFHHNISLKGVWPLMLMKRPWIVAHHVWYTRADGSLGWQDRLKRFVTRFAVNIAISDAVAQKLSQPDVMVIPNPYEDGLFRRIPEVPRNRDLVFLGRLVSDKGVDLLLDALALLVREGLRPDLTIVGNGPEEMSLLGKAKGLGLDPQVTFAGKKEGENLVRILNAHRVIVAPSRWNEPFGIVALEGIACGCAVIGSSGGGLPDAIGPCGVVFPNGDVERLAEAIRSLLTTPALLDRFAGFSAAHLAHFHKMKVAERYCQAVTKVITDARAHVR